ncbi:hypothetical protein RBB50_004791 [Rhinocladiella similis]
MRLINCQTFQLEWFADDSIPEYAILSHRWEDHEVSFEDMQGHFGFVRARRKKGYAKIQQSALIALRKHHLAYMWVDTCSINKESSAELSEAINSMYAWYKNSKVCLAYLSDVPGGEPATATSKFGRSLWFTRGWTLQELIAPEIVEFYASDWSYCGTREDLKEVIARITRIPRGVLANGNLERYSIARRMSWASDRRTTRVEDTAYCLLGIFNVNMPMIYGEGQKAFRRLQEEIIKRSDDQSIFAWTMVEDTPGLLANSPTNFKDCNDVYRVPNWATPVKRQHYAFTNMGLKIRMPLVIWSLDIYIGVLNCAKQDYGHAVWIGLFLIYKEGQYFRTTFGDTTEKHINTDDLELYHRTGQLIPERKMLIGLGWADQQKGLYGFRLDNVGIWNDWQDGRIRVDWIAVRWDRHSREFSIDAGMAGTVAVLFLEGLRSASNKTVFLHFAFDADFNLCCLLGHGNKEDYVSDLRREVDRPLSPRDFTTSPETRMPRASWALEDTGWALQETGPEPFNTQRPLRKTVKLLNGDTWTAYKLLGDSSVWSYRSEVIPDFGIRLTTTSRTSISVVDIEKEQQYEGFLSSDDLDTRLLPG